MNHSLLRFLRRFRPTLLARLETELATSLGEARARAEAEAFVEDAEKTLGAGNPETLRELVNSATERWSGLGVDAAVIRRSLASLVLPPDVLATTAEGTDSWAELQPVLTPLLESMPQPMLVVDLERRIRFANASAARLLAEPLESLPGRALGGLLVAGSRHWAARQLTPGALEQAGNRLGRVRFTARPDAEILVNAAVFRHAGQAAGWFMIFNPEPEIAFADPTLTELMQREQRQKDKFSALLTVSYAVVNTLELKTILSTIAQQVRQVIQTDECTVFLWEEAEQLLVPVVCDAASYQAEMMSVRLKLGEGITGLVALTGRGEIANGAENDPRSVQVPGTPEEDDSSLLCVPLYSREKVIGVITLVRVNDRYFNQEDLELATLFAGQCSAAIANARLYENLKSAFDELRETQTQLVQSAKLNALGEMAGGVAHDFNNILAAILGRTQLLLQTLEEPEVRRQLQVIEQAALDGAHTVRRVQEFTRVRNDERFETLDVNQVLTGVIELTRPAWEAGAKRRGVAIDVVQHLRATHPIAGNASELREVFTNLLLNAVDAMPEGGQLSVRTEDGPHDVQVRIRDSGVGMDEETRARVFDPFFTTKNVKGTGLGLSVAYGIVSRHRGTIEVNSRPGLGTEFVLGFPPGEGVLQMPAPAPDGPLPLFRVLVVDDEEPVLSVLADLLRALGQDVVQALGGAAGLAAFREREFDVVFSDLGMPEVNGWDLALAIKSERPATAVVLATGWGYQLEGTTAQAHGVDLVMPKPFSMEDVERVLRQLRESAVSGPMAA